MRRSKEPSVVLAVLPITRSTLRQRRIGIVEDRRHLFGAGEPGVEEVALDGPLVGAGEAAAGEGRLLRALVAGAGGDAQAVAAGGRGPVNREGAEHQEVAAPGR